MNDNIQISKNNNDYVYQISNSSLQNQSDQRISIFSLQKENYQLKCRIDQLNSENQCLRDKLSKYDEFNKDSLCEAYSKIEELNSLLNRAKVEKKNDDKFLREFINKAKGDNDRIRDLQNQIQALNDQIEQLNNKINIYQNREIDMKSEIDSLKVVKNKYDGLSPAYDGLKKENAKLRKNLQIFANENHFAAMKISELEGQIKQGNSKESLTNMKKEEELNLIIAALIEKINNIKLHLKNKQEIENQKKLNL